MDYLVEQELRSSAHSCPKASFQSAKLKQPNFLQISSSLGNLAHKVRVFLRQKVVKKLLLITV